ncbi:hypothetical protein ANN_12728 [Periplaneta americana]|uniref:Tc1-like transposase DDE domain-containing protein n=1 Tax=Periplaneta americana TaxID=6978 RepID=A0ABQ8TJX8_PERAM|nr:hypothetical protein ANN_12728 [Periplaneta americana]
MGKVKRGLDCPANASVNGKNTALLREIEVELVQDILMFEEYLFGLTITDRIKLKSSSPTLLVTGGSSSSTPFDRNLRYSSSRRTSSAERERQRRGASSKTPSNSQKIVSNRKTTTTTSTSLLPSRKSFHIHNISVSVYAGNQTLSIILYYVDKAATVQWYAENNVHQLDWPAHSPDLNPIEHLWVELDRRLRSREMRPTSIVQLSAILQEECPSKINKSNIDHQVRSKEKAGKENKVKRRDESTRMESTENGKRPDSGKQMCNTKEKPAYNDLRKWCIRNSLENKNCLSDRRRRFSFDNLRIDVYCNASNSINDDEDCEFADKPRTIPELIEMIVQTIQMVTYKMLSRIQEKMARHLNLCIFRGGRHVENCEP